MVLKGSDLFTMTIYSALDCDLHNSMLNYDRDPGLPFNLESWLGVTNQGGIKNRGH